MSAIRANQPWQCLEVAVVGAVAIGLYAISGYLPDYYAEIGFRLLILITLAEAWNLMAGYTGLVSLGTASFFGIGAYVFTFLINKHDLGIFPAILIGGLAAAFLAGLVSRAVFRLRGLYFTVGTLALAEAIRLFMINNTDFGGATGLFLSIDSPSLSELFVMGAALVIATSLLMTAITGSRVSILLRAVRDDEDAAAQIGVRPFRIKLLAFVLASFLAGMAGALQALKLGAIEPYGTFGVQWSVTVLSIVIIGGQGLRAGPVVGATFMVVLSEVLAEYPALHMAITGLILILVIRFAPNGIVGLLQKTISSRTWRTSK